MALLIGGVSFDDQEQARPRRRRADRHAGPPARPFRARQAAADRRRDPGDRRSRPHARHGLHPRYRADLSSCCRFTRQTLFFSATMAPEIQRLTDTFLHEPGQDRGGAAGDRRPRPIEQLLVQSVAASRRQARRAARADPRSRGPAPTPSSSATASATSPSCPIAEAPRLQAPARSTATWTSASRTATLDGFRDGELTLLVASDVAARGLDIPAVSHVFNFDVPTHAEDYVHRIGRTGRAGRTGTAITIATPADRKYVAAIERLTGLPIKTLEVEASDELAAARYGKRAHKAKADEEFTPRPGGIPTPRPAGTLIPRPGRYRAEGGVQAHAKTGPDANGTKERRGSTVRSGRSTGTPPSGCAAQAGARSPSTGIPAETAAGGADAVRQLRARPAIPAEAGPVQILRAGLTRPWPSRFAFLFR